MAEQGQAPCSPVGYVRKRIQRHLLTDRAAWLPEFFFPTSSRVFFMVPFVSMSTSGDLLE
jgi:hypothetical protein